jgi:hypothetical protein
VANIITHTGPKTLAKQLLGAISLGIKRLWHKADHSPPFSAAVKKEWNHIPIPTHAFKASTGVIKVVTGSKN